MLRALLQPVLIWLALAPLNAAAQPPPDPPPDPPPVQPHQRGAFFARLPLRSDLSAQTEMFKRFRHGNDPPEPDYRPEQEVFKLIVPEDYDGQAPYGVVVYISPSGGQWMMGDPYAAVWARRRLIFVTALNAGNDRNVWHRLGLAIDAVHNLRQAYRLDEQRVYVAGHSGGGYCASQLGLAYGDLFTGTLAMGGLDYFQMIHHPDDMFKAWRPGMAPPPAEMLRTARFERRFVLLVGAEDDEVRPKAQSVYKMMRESRFAYVSYMEVPGMGHELPPASSLDQAIGALDAPLEPLRAAQAERVRRLEPIAAARFAEALRLAETDVPAGYELLRGVARSFRGTEAAARAADHADQLWSQHRADIEAAAARTEARRQLTLAKNYIAAARHEAAREPLETIIRQFPTTPEADEARRLLEVLGR